MKNTKIIENGTEREAGITQDCFARSLKSWLSMFLGFHIVTLPPPPKKKKMPKENAFPRQATFKDKEEVMDTTNVY